jgi:hypothetical protein
MIAGLVLLGRNGPSKTKKVESKRWSSDSRNHRIRKRMTRIEIGKAAPIEVSDQRFLPSHATDVSSHVRKVQRIPECGQDIKTW